MSDRPFAFYEDWSRVGCGYRVFADIPKLKGEIIAQGMTWLGADLLVERLTELESFFRQAREDIRMASLAELVRQAGLDADPADHRERLEAAAAEGNKWARQTLKGIAQYVTVKVG